MTHAIYNTGHAVPLNFRPEIDYRGLHISTQDALYAIERGQLKDFWPAYERMHESAGMGPMVWTGKEATAAFAVSGNKASLVAGHLDIAALERIVRGLARNVEAEDRFGAWKITDHVVHGARRIYLYGLRKSVALTSHHITRLQHDLSSRGLQDKADYQSQLATLTRDLANELIVSGLATETAVAS